MLRLEWGTVSSQTENGWLLKVEDVEVVVDKTQTLGDMEVGEKYFVAVWQDPESNQVLGSEKIREHLQDIVPETEFNFNQRLEGVVYQQTDLGYNVFFGEQYTGLLYENEVFTRLTMGQEIDVYIKEIRKDGRVSLSLYPLHFKDAANTIQKLIISKLLENEGKLSLSDSSTPEQIYESLGISKKKFKQAVGMLYKQKRIRIFEDRIELANEILG